MNIITATKIFVALLPVAVLLFFIIREDRLKREPAWVLLLAFVMGVASVGASMIVSVPLDFFDTMRLGAFFGSFYDAFFLAAIPEEAAKLLMLWLLLRKNKYFDEYFDGIVYAVCVGMGFAGLENVMYIFGNDEWVGVAITRGLLAVPAHFTFAVFMGYYYSLWAAFRNRKYLLLTFLAPMLAHGAYDFVLMYSGNAENFSVGIIAAFIAMMYKFHKRNRAFMAEHMQRDIDILEASQNPPEIPDEPIDWNG